MISETIELLVIDTQLNQPKTGDAANLTAYLSIDGGALTELTTPGATEVDAVRAKGVYRFALSEAERTGSHWLFSGSSSTTGVSVIPAVIRAATTAVTLTLGATLPLALGEVTGLTEPLVVGDDYTEDVGRRIPIVLTDINGDAIDVEYGTHSLATDCSIKMLFQPEGRNTTKAAITGTCTYVAAVGATPAFLWLTLPREETRKASQDTYQTQIEARWTDGFNVTLAHKGTAKFTRDIQRLS
jgi:hypothetical protein